MVMMEKITLKKGPGPHTEVKVRNIKELLKRIKRRVNNHNSGELEQRLYTR